MVRLWRLRAGVWISVPTQPASPPAQPDLSREIRRSISALERRADLIERALSFIQRDVGYFGLCVNNSLHPDRKHPHWDDDV